MPFQQGKIVRVKSTTMEDDKEIERLARKYRGQTTMSSRGPEYIKIIFPSEFYANKFMSEFDEPDEVRWMGENAVTENINENVYIRGSAVFVTSNKFVTDDPENGVMYNDMISKARKFGGRVVYLSKNLYKITFKTSEIANKYAHSIADPEFIEQESMNESKKAGPMESTLPTLSSFIPEAVRSKKKPTKFVSTFASNVSKKPSKPKKPKKGKFTMPTAQQQANYNQKTNLFSPHGRTTKEGTSPHKFDFGVGFMVDKDDISPGKFALYVKDPMTGKGRRIAGNFESMNAAHQYLKQNGERIRKVLKSTGSKNI